MGLFAGVAIDGTVITIDRTANAAYYEKRDVTASEIFADDAPAPPPAAQRYLATLDQSTRTASVPGADAPSAGATEQSAPTPATTTESPARTFPMEDPNPGQEPPG
jgi:hypothetical protein